MRSVQKQYRHRLAVAPLLAVVGALTCSMLGCVGTSRATRLYPGAELPQEKLARLSGPIERVDGQEVSGGGGSFELLPGCHVVQIGGRVGDTGWAPQGAWSATLPRLIYALPMRAGRSYSISFEPEPALGRRSIGFGRIVARERDGQGHERILPAARSRADLTACLRDAAES